MAQELSPRTDRDAKGAAGLAWLPGSRRGFAGRWRQGETVKEKGEEDDSGVRHRCRPQVPRTGTLGGGGGGGQPRPSLAPLPAPRPRPAPALPHPPVTSARAAILGSAAAAAASSSPSSSSSAASARDPGRCGGPRRGRKAPRWTPPTPGPPASPRPGSSCLLPSAPQPADIAPAPRSINTEAAGAGAVRASRPVPRVPVGPVGRFGRSHDLADPAELGPGAAAHRGLPERSRQGAGGGRRRRQRRGRGAGPPRRAGRRRQGRLQGNAADPDGGGAPAGPQGPRGAGAAGRAGWLAARGSGLQVGAGRGRTCPPRPPGSGTLRPGAINLSRGVRESALSGGAPCAPDPPGTDPPPPSAWIFFLLLFTSTLPFEVLASFAFLPRFLLQTVAIPT